LFSKIHSRSKIDLSDFLTFKHKFMGKAPLTAKTTVPDQVNVITLKCAKEWHKAFKDQNKRTGFGPGEFPSSIAIPFPDIEQIVNDFRDTGDAIVNGVRLYFIIKPGGAHGAPMISCMLVPTQGPLPNPEGIFTDLVVNTTLKEDTPKNPYCPGPGSNPGSDGSVRMAGDTDDGYVSIYDVTRPCPPYCDPESPIYD
jgi:hypothetical protein